MSWRDTFTGKGSFRGIEFLVRYDEAEVGRRTALHQYPLRDKPYAEDMGRAARSFTFDAYVLGDDYMTKRDALIAALEKKGTATLVHPYYGTMRVKLLRPARVQQNTRRGGMAVFSIAVVEDGGLQFPTQSADTQASVKTKADALNTAATSDFVSKFNISGLPDKYVSDLSTEIDATLSSLTSTVTATTSPISSLIRQPANMAGAIVGTMHEVLAQATEPLCALNLYGDLFDASGSMPIVTTTSTRRQQATSAQAVHLITQRSAVAEACRASAEASYSSRDQALTIMSTLLDAIDAQQLVTGVSTGDPIDGDVYEALEALRASVVEDLRTRGAQLPSLISYKPDATLPALVVAHRLYGDATRADEIVTRNHITHPLFVPGGEPLEVLNA